MPKVIISEEDLFLVGSMQVKNTTAIMIPSPGNRKIQFAVATSVVDTTPSHIVLAPFITYRTDVFDVSKVFPVTCRPSELDKNMPFSPIILLSVI